MLKTIRTVVLSGALISTLGGCSNATYTMPVGTYHPPATNKEGRAHNAVTPGVIVCGGKQYRGIRSCAGIYRNSRKERSASIVAYGRKNIYSNSNSKVDAIAGGAIYTPSSKHATSVLPVIGVQINHRGRGKCQPMAIITPGTVSGGVECR